MTDRPDREQIAEQLQSFEEVDREIVRLALLCQVSILVPGVIERVLHKDLSVCGTENPRAFEKLRGMLIMHFGIWQKSAQEFGSAEVSQVEQYVIERLKKSLPDHAAQLSGAR